VRGRLAAAGGAVWRRSAKRGASAARPQALLAAQRLSSSSAEAEWSTVSLTDRAARRFHAVPPDGVAARPQDDQGRTNHAGLQRLADILGGTQYLRTALSGSVAARLHDDAWFQGLQRLADMLGGTQYMRTALSDSVAARLHDDAWFQGLQRLADMLGGTQYLRTALSNGSVASRLENEDFKTNVATIVQLVGKAKTASLLGRSCVVVRLDRIVATVQSIPADERTPLCSRMVAAASRGARDLEALLVH
jgi:predicted secreted protein